jgi:hypothetical protein
VRTTLQIDDDVYRAAASLAAAEGKPLGKVLSELARRGLAPRPYDTSRSGFPVFRVAEDAPPLTAEMVRRADEDEG